MTETVTVRAVAQHWRETEQEKYTPRSFVDRDRVVTWFVAEYGDKPAMEINPGHAISWIRARKTWKAANTRRGIAQLLHHVFALAVRHRVLPSNPIAYLGADFPAGDRRRPVTTEEMKAVLRASDQHFRDIALFLWRTGCRPGEAENLTWREVDWECRCLRIAKHKTLKKTKMPRIAPLEGPALRQLKLLLARRPTGQAHVFTNSLGKPWTAQSMAGRKKALVEAGVMPRDAYWHGLRHSYATLLLLAGGTIEDVANQLGNSIQVAEKVYCDLSMHSVKSAEKLDQIRQRRRLA